MYFIFKFIILLGNEFGDIVGAHYGHVSQFYVQYLCARPNANLTHALKDRLIIVLDTEFRPDDLISKQKKNKARFI